MSNSKQLRVFVGSSSEAEEYYESICGALENLGHSVVGWKSAFEKGESFLDSLFRVGSEVDAALLIGTPDDVIHSRGKQHTTLRDNVLFEAGLFMGVLGRFSTGIVISDHSEVKLPSDLAGLNTFVYREGRENSFAKDLRKWTGSLRTILTDNGTERQISERFRGIPSSFLQPTIQLLIPRIQTLLLQASNGVIDLTPEQYFERIRTGIEEAMPETSVYAVASTLSSVRWANDPMQSHYIEQNYIAGARGVNIRRLFILDRPSLTTSEARTLMGHLENGIPVRCVSRNSLTTPIDDVVLFDYVSDPSVAYKAHSDRTFSERVVAAQMMIDQDHCNDLLRRFNEIWGIAWTPKVVDGAIEIPGMRVPPPTKHPFAPGLEMQAKWTSVEVITCHSAAEVRGHELERELKSLVLTTSSGLSVVHVPGHCRVSLRKVKDYLGDGAEAHMADPEELLEIGLGPGTVCAVLEPIWSMLHFIDHRLFEHKEVATNNGTRNGYFRFDPNVLKSARNVEIGDFIERIVPIT